MMTKKNMIWERLQRKSVDLDATIPSIEQISKLLTLCGISHTVNEKTHTVEHRSKGKRYVNSRRKGKTGKRLRVYLTPAQMEKLNVNWIELDTSDTYYSMNSKKYAGELVELIKMVMGDKVDQL